MNFKQKRKRAHEQQRGDCCGEGMWMEVEEGMGG